MGFKSLNEVDAADGTVQLVDGEFAHAVLHLDDPMLTYSSGRGAPAPCQHEHRTCAAAVEQSR